MKIRTVKLTPEFLTQLLQGKTAPFTSNLPSDAELLDIKVDLFTKQVSAVVRSDSFEDVAEAMPIPEFNLTNTAETKTAPKQASTAAVKAELKSSVAKLTQPQPSRIAIKMENEFSPEQRKLLSFSVKGDVVVVKPVTFLKVEWEDINEVVRSLGGKWVKGGIISYWEIPMQ
jgi:ATP-dependent exoDNAse (exonuclease V) alpha subunit